MFFFRDTVSHCSLCWPATSHVIRDGRRSVTVCLPRPPLCWDGRYEPLHQKTVTHRGDIHTQRITWWQRTWLIPKVETPRAGEAAQQLGAFADAQGTQVQFPDSHGGSWPSVELQSQGIHLLLLASDGTACRHKIKTLTTQKKKPTRTLKKKKRTKYVN